MVDLLCENENRWLYFHGSRRVSIMENINAGLSFDINGPELARNVSGVSCNLAPLANRIWPNRSTIDRQLSQAGRARVVLPVWLARAVLHAGYMPVCCDISGQPRCRSSCSPSTRPRTRCRLAPTPPTQFCRVCVPQRYGPPTSTDFWRKFVGGTTHNQSLFCCIFLSA